MDPIDIILPKEAMAFYILNALGHDSALHDFTPSSELGKGRVLNILNGTDIDLNGMSMFGGGEEEPPMENTVVAPLYNAISDNTSSGLVKHTFVQSSKGRYGEQVLDNFIIVHIPVQPTAAAGGKPGRQGVAPGFVYTSDKTFSPFEFIWKSNDASRIQTYHYQHNNSTNILAINPTGLDGDSTLAVNGKNYTLVEDPVEFNNTLQLFPDTVNAYIANKNLTRISPTAFIYLPSLLGSPIRFEQLLKEFIGGYADCDEYFNHATAAEETAKIQALISTGPDWFTQRAITFWTTLTTAAAAGTDTFITEIHSQINFPTKELHTIILHFKYVCNAIECGFHYSYPGVAFIQYDENDIYIFVIKWLVFQAFQVSDTLDINMLNNAIDSFTNACERIKQLVVATQPVPDPKDVIDFCELMLNTLSSVKASQEDATETVEDKEEVIAIAQSPEAYVNALFRWDILVQNPDNNDGDFWSGNGFANVLKLIANIKTIIDILFPAMEWGADGFPTNQVTRQELEIIFTDAVGTEHAENLFNYLKKVDYSDTDMTKLVTIIALLQSLLESLILRLDDDLLVQFANSIGIQLGGGKKKSDIIFDGTFVLAITGQLRGRNARIRAKLKELFASANDSLPQYYIDAVLGGPSYANVLAWDFSTQLQSLFSGFFAKIPAVTMANNAQLQVVINAGAVSPQIPVTLLDELSRDDFNPNFNEINYPIPGLQAFLGVYPPTRDSLFALNDVLQRISIPFLFNPNDDESSNTFVTFEYGYMYLLKCVMIYFATGASFNITPFVELLHSCTNLYIEMVNRANTILAVSTALTNQQRICTGYCLGGILQSVMTPMKPILSQFPKSALLSIETTEINRILASKAAVGRSILQNAAFGDADTKLYNKFIKWVDTTYMPRSGTARFHSNDKLMGRLWTDLNAQGWTGNVVGLLPQTGGEKYYINNAVSAPFALGSVNSNFFCPISSVMDNMPICSTTTTAQLKNGLETGIMDVMIHDPENSMTYRVRVVPNADSSRAKIAAYVQINDEVLINVGDEETSAGTTWPGGSNPAIPVNLLGGDPNPMDAKTCLRGIFEAYHDILTKYGIISYENLLDQLSSPDPSATNLPSQLRRVILEASFQKSLGDILQELAGVADNGGYESIANNPQYFPAGVPIFGTGDARLQLNNDRPSAVRTLLLILYATQGINPNVIAGFMTEWKDKKKISISKYALAINNQTGGSGKGIISKKGGTKKTKRTKKRRNKRKHTKKIKFRKAPKSKKHRKTKRKGK